MFSIVLLILSGNRHLKRTLALHLVLSKFLLKYEKDLNLREEYDIKTNV